MTIDDWWDTWQRPYRHAIVDAIRGLGGVERVMEGGCHCGPNLRLLDAELPQLALAGFDRAPQAIAWAQARFPQAAFAVDEWAAAAFSGGFGGADVVLSCYSLAYVPPEHLEPVLVAALAAVPVLVMAEPMPTTTEPAGRVAGAQWDAQTPEYRHDYAAVLAGHCSIIEQRPLPRWDRLNGLLLVRA